MAKNEHLWIHPDCVQLDCVCCSQTETHEGRLLHETKKTPHCHLASHLHQICPYQPDIQKSNLSILPGPEPELYLSTIHFGQAGIIEHFATFPKVKKIYCYQLVWWGCQCCSSICPIHEQRLWNAATILQSSSHWHHIPRSMSRWSGWSWIWRRTCSACSSCAVCRARWICRLLSLSHTRDTLSSSLFPHATAYILQ